MSPDTDLRAQNAALQFLHQIAAASNEARSTDEVLAFAVRAVCAYTGWPVGHALQCAGREEPHLESAGIWHAEPEEKYQRLRQASEAVRLRPGVGLPGRVMQSGAPAWVAAVSRDGNFPRAALALDVGVRAAFAFPVLIGARVVAVLEFFSDREEEPDALLLDVMAQAGTQMGRVFERSEADQALRASEERYRTVAEAAVDAIIMTDHTGIVQDWNRGAERIFGFLREDIVGKNVDRIMPVRYRERHQRGMERHQRTGEAHVIGHTVELHGLRKDQSEFPLELSLSEWRAGGETFYTGIIRDITERHLASEAMRRSEQALERTNRELVQRNRELQDFAYVASHDLQEPLRKISTFAELLGAEYEPQLGEEGRSYMERIRSAAVRMSRLIQDLLQFSRVSTTGQPFEAVDLNHIVDEVLSDLEIRIAETGGRIEVQEALPRIEADPIQMRQLFQNLIGNALKFHRPSAPPVVRVSAAITGGSEAPVAAAPDVCRIEVADNGIGFDEKYLDRIFSPFQRLHTRTEYEGTGMGLAICRRIAERHRGSITARSVQGEGTTFIVALPVHQGPADW